MKYSFNTFVGGSAVNPTHDYLTASVYLNDGVTLVSNEKLPYGITLKASAAQTATGTILADDGVTVLAHAGDTFYTLIVGPYVLQNTELLSINGNPSFGTPGLDLDALVSAAARLPYFDPTLLQIPAIIGPGAMPNGSTQIFNNTLAGGAWSVDNPTRGTINTVTGSLHANTTGPLQVLYTVGYTQVSLTVNIF